MTRCLYCYQPLPGGQVDFHTRCSRKLFDQATPPILPYTEEQMEELARQTIRSQIAVTGVQPKLSLELAPAEREGEPKRLTIIGLWGGYILKPPSQHYRQLPGRFTPSPSRLINPAGNTKPLRVNSIVYSLVLHNSFSVYAKAFSLIPTFDMKVKPCFNAG